MATTSHPAIPEFSAELLVDLGRAIGRRAKALRYQASSFACENGRDDGFERLTVCAEIYNRAKVRINVWEDEHLWLGVHVPQKVGWKFALTSRGQLVAVDLGHFVPAVEATIARVGGNNYNTMTDDLLDIWNFAGLVVE